MVLLKWLSSKTLDFSGVCVVELVDHTFRSETDESTHLETSSVEAPLTKLVSAHH